MKRLLTWLGLSLAVLVAIAAMYAAFAISQQPGLPPGEQDKASIGMAVDFPRYKTEAELRSKAADVLIGKVTSNSGNSAFSLEVTGVVKGNATVGQKLKLRIFDAVLNGTRYTVDGVPAPQPNRLHLVYGSVRADVLTPLAGGTAIGFGNNNGSFVFPAAVTGQSALTVTEADLAKH